ncbi:MAG: hypothetical protein QS748_09145 [Candidatus Endonucleobacter bathymodioli]|uniref:Uncharacterized protein n=1 Tax=Candidatus Endonucleibacter bathymodioli TaxID=539814 RepID=A0AA90SDH4_9GAMM|nr:hypothetical protein [Candidatus Endonucleobacter bathymodioli]
MEYSEEFPHISWPVEKDDARKSMLRKATDWEYENEFRIVLPGVYNTHLEIKPESVTGVIFGCNIEDKAKKAINNLLLERKNKGLPDIQRYKAKKHDNKYKICIYNSSNEEMKFADSVTDPDDIL